MHSSYIITFYLPYHYPIKTYQPHFDSRYPANGEGMCNCYRLLNLHNRDICNTCLIAEEFIPAIQSGTLTEKSENLVKPISCGICYTCFADKTLLSNGKLFDNKQIIPKALTVAELKNTCWAGEGPTTTRLQPTFRSNTLSRQHPIPKSFSSQYHSDDDCAFSCTEFQNVLFLSSLS